MSELGVCAYAGCTNPGSIETKDRSLICVECATANSDPAPSPASRVPGMRPLGADAKPESTHHTSHQQEHR